MYLIHLESERGEREISASGTKRERERERDQGEKVREGERLSEKIIDG